MLVLSRKAGEKIHIGDGITIEVRRVAGNRVTLAIDAPRDLRILRGELEKAVGAFEGLIPTDASEEPQPAEVADSTPRLECAASHLPRADRPATVIHNRLPLQAFRAAALRKVAR